MNNLTHSLIVLVSGLFIFPISFGYFDIDRNWRIVVTLSVILAVLSYLLPPHFHLVGVAITASIGIFITQHNSGLEVFKAITAVAAAIIPLDLMFDVKL